MNRRRHVDRHRKSRHKGRSVKVDHDIQMGGKALFVESVDGFAYLLGRVGGVSMSNELR